MKTKKKTEQILVHETCIGVDEMVDDLKASFKTSCEHHGVPENDPIYFQEYMFFLYALIFKELQYLKEKK